MKLRIDQILVSKDNPRQSFDEEGLRRLGESIQDHGLLQPIIVRPKGTLYELVVGERRLRASKLIGLDEIDVLVQELDDVTCMKYRLIENTQREDLTEAEKGNAIATILERFPEEYPTIQSLAKELTKSESTITSWFRKSEKLSDEIKKFVMHHKLSDYTAGKLLKFDYKTQNKLATAIIKYEIKQTKDELQIQFIKQYELNPEKYPTVESLEDLANEVKGIKKVRVDLTNLSPEARAEIEGVLKKAKEQAKKARAKRPRKPRSNKRRQGRPKKKKEPLPPEEKNPLPPLTISIKIKTVTVALNFPIPLLERLGRYCALKTLIFEKAIISLLETHSDLEGI